ncbi:hypothetical protein [Nostoc sp. FACHB-133]|uniref:hypothetical protein n=1 Tax=Nostoc sp. FACHB-133 TaxID=2692835 RepID=UPI001682719B|nr:hypothetical protein [Nostoc sp. FACHB-133]MBD2520959.1 hypothetical protein [Nostoc sp. FACHB-133]
MKKRRSSASDRIHNYAKCTEPVYPLRTPKELPDELISVSCPIWVKLAFNPVTRLKN